MGAITKAFTAVADSAVDPDSPIDATLMTALRDRDEHVREWMGFSFYAGAVQDHNHDGVNSALVPVGPNQVRNGSFEDGESGWTFTDFTGGTHAISTSTHRHGAKSAQITSTVLANGGGDALTNEFMLVSQADTVGLKFWIGASVANISSKLEVTWYDNAKASISTTVVQSYTNTPTTLTFHSITATAPANARFYKVRLTGGIPGSGSATGTITFDGIEGFGSGRVMAQSQVDAAVIGQAQIKTATASSSVSVANNNTATYNLTGGSHAMWTASADDNAGGGAGGISWGNGNLGAGSLGVANSTGATRNFYVDERYFQASPPYNLGNGDIPLFVFALVRGDGTLAGVSVAPDPTWAYNGPTIITPERYENGRGYRRYRELEGMRFSDALKDPAVRLRYMREQSQIVLVEREITHAIKNADMPLFPHPWVGGDLTGLTAVMLDPMGRLIDRLMLIAEDQGAREVRDLILAGHLQIGNTPLALNAPPGVMPVAASWRAS